MHATFVRVVVIDRFAPVRARLAAHLREAGVEYVEEADSLAMARAIISALQPDAIVADVVHPDCRATDVVGVLKALAPAARLLILTNEVHVRGRCLADGAQGFFDKSTQLEELVFALRVS